MAEEAPEDPAVAPRPQCCLGKGGAKRQPHKFGMDCYAATEVQHGTH